MTFRQDIAVQICDLTVIVGLLKVTVFRFSKELIKELGKLSAFRTLHTLDFSNYSAVRIVSNANCFRHWFLLLYRAGALAIAVCGSLIL
jgi:hypothetical protein